MSVLNITFGVLHWLYIDTEIQYKQNITNEKHSVFCPNKRIPCPKIFFDILMHSVGQKYSSQWGDTHIYTHMIQKSISLLDRQKYISHYTLCSKYTAYTMNVIPTWSLVGLLLLNCVFTSPGFINLWTDVHYTILPYFTRMSGIFGMQHSNNTQRNTELHITLMKKTQKKTRRVWKTKRKKATSEPSVHCWGLSAISTSDWNYFSP